jgi:putative flippase GtrA
MTATVTTSDALRASPNAPSAVHLPTASSTTRSPLALLRSDLGRKSLRFAAVSGVAIVTSVAVLVWCYGVMGWHGSLAWRAQLASFAVSTAVSYLLNRAWVWGRSGRSSFATEIAPFWILAIVQLAVSLLYVGWSQRLVEDFTENHALRTIGVVGNNLFIYGLMWIGKFVVLNRLFERGRAATTRTGGMEDSPM